MTPTEIIQHATTDGVRFSFSSMTGRFRMGGDHERVTQWLPFVERQKEEIRDVLESISVEREERAAIYEYDAKMSRREAEERAGIRHQGS